MNHAMLSPEPHWTELSRTAHWVVEREAARRIIRIRRTPEPLVDLNDWQREGAALKTVLALYDPTTYGLLLDLRDGPLRTDPEFEAQVRPGQQKAIEGFARSAVLVRTAVGRLQVARTRREEGRGPDGIFHEEVDALAYLAKPAPRRGDGGTRAR